MNPSDPRFSQLTVWLSSLPAALGLDLASLAPASSDASFRRYFRVMSAQGTRIVMDAPPAHEDCAPFVKIATMLRDGGVNAPQILAQDVEQGFLLLTDLGTRTYYDCIQAGVPARDLQAMYADTLDALVKMQQIPADGLPPYSAARFAEELTVFPEWYVARHHGVALDDDTRNALQGVFDTLSAASAAGPRVLVHRDFHSPNLVLAESPQNGANPGVIDFQDALHGPLAYDVASLVMDARTTWEEPQQLDWAIRYWERARAAGLPVDSDFSVFHREYEWIGLQRNLRILGVFARLNHRDNKPGYLNHMPRVNQYVRQVAQRYEAFTPLRRLLDRLDQVTVGYTF